VSALAISGSNLYVGGPFNLYRNDTRGSALVKVSATTGVMDTTNFNAVAPLPIGSTVLALASYGTKLYIGGPFTGYQGDMGVQNACSVDATAGYQAW
jgi:hypothetical protein